MVKVFTVRGLKWRHQVAILNLCFIEASLNFLLYHIQKTFFACDREKNLKIHFYSTKHPILVDPDFSRDVYYLYLSRLCVKVAFGHRDDLVNDLGHPKDIQNPFFFHFFVNDFFICTYIFFIQKSKFWLKNRN